MVTTVATGFCAGLVGINLIFVLIPFVGSFVPALLFGSLDLIIRQFDGVDAAAQSYFEFQRFRIVRLQRRAGTGLATQAVTGAAASGMMVKNTLGHDFHAVTLDGDGGSDGGSYGAHSFLVNALMRSS
jgi:hypothetical protein